MQLLRFHGTALAAVAAALGLAAAQPARAVVAANPLNPVTFAATFTGDGTISTNPTNDPAPNSPITDAPYTTEFSGSSFSVSGINPPGLTIASDAPILFYTPTPVLPVIDDLAQPKGVVVDQSFLGTDTISADDGFSTLNVALSGTVSGPGGNGSAGGLNGGLGLFDFTGTATFSGGTGVFAGTSGTDLFTLAETGEAISARPGVQPHVAGPAGYTATYAPLAAAVPEPSSFALLGLGLLPLGGLMRRARRK